MIPTAIANSNILVRKSFKINDNPYTEKITRRELSNSIPQGYITIEEFDQATTEMINDLFSSNDKGFIQRKSKKRPN
ncbi:MAG: hypothetical protein LBI82_00845 [Dysgonamonadaceae bacterium]|jgi:hypothetical protein|nr:hypothetical protein [Dysgonamonadaceae bacterium]